MSTKPKTAPAAPELAYELPAEPAVAEADVGTPAAVVYELVGGLTGFEFGNYDGTLIRVEASGFKTDDPRTQTELDSQTHAVRRKKS